MKGYTNNPNGRPKGTPNKITQDMRMWLSSVLDKPLKRGVVMVKILLDRHLK